MPSVFTKIIQNQIPAFIVYQNDLTIAFLDIQPINLGHLLIVPKVEVDSVFDLPKNHYLDLFETAKKLSTPLQKATLCDRVGMLVEGFEIPHAHLHLVPIYQADKNKFEKTRLSFSGQKMEEIATKISSFL